MKLLYAAAFLLTMGGSAFAQSTTECRTAFSGLVRCQTNPVPSPDWRALTEIPSPSESMMDGYERAARMRAIEEERQLLEQRRSDLTLRRDADERSRTEIEKADGGDDLRREVGRLLSDGQCKEAENTALVAGNIELAAAAKAYCRESE